MTTPDDEGPDAPAPKRDDIRGILTFEGPLPNLWQCAEDATQFKDYASQSQRPGVRERPATSVERALLTHLGYILPAELTVRVEYLTATLRRRTFPQLEGQTP